MTACYSLCDCVCGQVDGAFDRTVASETQFQESLQCVCHSNIGWYSDKSLCDAQLDSWRLDGVRGLYLLWHKDDYCDVHEMFHMRALYVGKGLVRQRLYSHWRDKDFSEELLVYWSYVEMLNRQAKYYEQLLLDSYDFPFNKEENGGIGRLCAHFSQSEVD